MKGADEKRRAKTDRRLVALVWSLAAVIVLLMLAFFDVTPADVAYQVSRCLRCH